MFIPPHKTFEELSRPAAEIFRFWVSLWPAAPLFGVEWRFADFAATVAPLPPGSPEQEADAATAAQEATAEALAEAPAVAPPVAEEALEPRPELAEPAIERTLEPEPAEPRPTAETGKAEAAAAPADEPTLDFGGDAGARPDGLLDTAPEQADDLKQIRGIGPALERQLNGLGVYRLEQVAGFSKANLGWIDDNLTSFKGRCFRDDWIGQAKALLKA